MKIITLDTCHGSLKLASDNNNQKREGMVATKRDYAERFRRQGKKVATRRAIQDEFLVELARVGFKFGVTEKEPRGLLAKVTATVNRMRYGNGYLKVSRETART